MLRQSAVMTVGIAQYAYILGASAALAAAFAGLTEAPVLFGLAALYVVGGARLALSRQQETSKIEQPGSAALEQLPRRVLSAQSLPRAATEILAAVREIADASVIVSGNGRWLDHNAQTVPGVPEDVGLEIRARASIWIEDGGAPDAVAGWLASRKAYAAIPMEHDGSLIGLILVTESDVSGARRSIVEACARAAESSLRIRDLKETAAVGRAASVEVDLAAELQRRLVPGRAHLVENDYELTAHYEPATHCAGDWWASYDVGDKLIVVVGDVTGHGLASAMVSAAAKGASDSYIASAQEPDPSTLMTLLDATVRRVGRNEFFMTCFASVLDTKSGEMTFTNAGHLAPYIVRGEDGKLEPLLARGNPLGAGAKASIGTGTGQAHTGNHLIWYTDRITERLDSEGNMYGDRRLQRLLRGVGRIASAGALEGAIIESVSDFASGTPPDDDITMVVVRVSGVAR